MGKSGKEGSDFIDDMAANAIEATGQRVLSQEEIDALINSIGGGDPGEGAPSPEPTSEASPVVENQTSQGNPSDKPFSEDEIDNLLSDIKKKKSRGQSS